MPKTSFKPDNINCSVFSCTSKASRERHVSFHKYPEYGENKVRIINKFGVEELLDRRIAWINATQTTRKITRFMKVCSLHFKDDDFYPFALQPTAKRRKLKVNAVPSLNLPTESLDESVFLGPVPKQLDVLFPVTSRDKMTSDIHDEHNYVIRGVMGEPPTKENHWTLSQVEALIDEYKKNRILFDIDHEEFNNEDLKIEYLDNIVDALQFCRSGTTQADVVSQWNNLIQYVYGQRKLHETNLPKKSRSWYLQKLEFLKDHWQMREVKLELEEFSQPDVDPLAPIMEVTIKEEILEESPPGKSDDESTISCEENDNKSLDHESDVFGTFVTTQLKKITSQEVQQDAIFEIHQVLHKALRENVELSN